MNFAEGKHLIYGHTGVTWWRVKSTMGGRNFNLRRSQKEWEEYFELVLNIHVSVFLYPPPYSAEVREKAKLYLYSPFRSLWPVGEGEPCHLPVFY